MFAWLRLSIVLLFFVGMSVLAFWPDRFIVGSNSGNSAALSLGSTDEPDRDDPEKDVEPESSAYLPALNGQRLPPTDVPVSGEEYASVQERLQDLGVDYFLLERAPGESPVFRFHCRISLPGSGVYVRPFEAIDRDPLRAMRRVLADVEAWSAARTTSSRVLR